MGSTYHWLSRAATAGSLLVLAGLSMLPASAAAANRLVLAEMFDNAG